MKAQHLEELLHRFARNRFPAVVLRRVAGAGEFYKVHWKFLLWEPSDAGSSVTNGEPPERFNPSNLRTVRTFRHTARGTESCTSAIRSTSRRASPHPSCNRHDVLTKGLPNRYRTVTILLRGLPIMAPVLPNPPTNASFSSHARAPEHQGTSVNSMLGKEYSSRELFSVS